jgi:hypothetical protein
VLPPVLEALGLRPIHGTIEPEMTRSAAIIAALQREITKRQAGIDADNDIGSVTVTVKLKTGPVVFVQGTEYKEERIMRARDQRHP